MKIAIAVAVAVASITGIPLLAQDSNTDSNSGPAANDSAKVTYAPAAGGFGDLAASHAWEMSAVTGELEGKLDSKTAKVGDRVVLKITEKVQTPDGTLIPRGSRLVGHVTEVQAYDLEIGPARIAIAFDHMELKNGQSIAIYTLIRGVSPIASASGASAMRDDNMIGMPVPPGGLVNGGRMGPEEDGIYVRGAGATGGSGGQADGPADRTADAGASGSGRADPEHASTASTGTQGSGGSNTDTGAHGVAAARAQPHPTNIRGVMLAGNSSSSGVLLALVRNIQFESGTQIELGVVANR
jgi:hypothetical protein